MPKQKNKIKSKSSTKAVKVVEAPLLEPLWAEEPKATWHFDFGKFSFGLFLVVLGLLYLAQNSGWLPIDMNFSLWQLWPMILIFFGLSFISGKGWTGLVTGSIFTMTVLTIATIFISDKITLRLEPELTSNQFNKHLSAPNSEQSFPINIDKLSLTETANLNIVHQLGNLNISAGTSDKLIIGGLNSNYAKLLINTQATDNSQSVQLESVSQKSQAGTSRSQLDLALANNLPINLSLNSGASQLDLNFRNLSIQNLQAHTNGSDINLSLANQSVKQNLDFQGHINTLTLNLTNDINLKINSPAIATLDLINLSPIKNQTNSLISSNYSPSSSSIELNLSKAPDKIILNWQ